MEMKRLLLCVVLFSVLMPLLVEAEEWHLYNRYNFSGNTTTGSAKFDINGTSVDIGGSGNRDFRQYNITNSLAELFNTTASFGDRAIEKFDRNNSVWWTGRRNADNAVNISSYNSDGTQIESFLPNVPPFNVVSGLRVNNSQNGFLLIGEIDNATNDVVVYHLSKTGGIIHNRTVSALADNIASNSSHIFIFVSSTPPRIETYDLALNPNSNISFNRTTWLAGLLPQDIDFNNSEIWAISSSQTYIASMVRGATSLFSHDLRNNGSTARANASVNFQVRIVSDSNLSFYVFAHNNTGTFANTTFRSASSNSVLDVNESFTVQQAKNKNICGHFWFNDTNNNFLQTANSCFNVVNTPPVVSDVKINNTPINTNSANGSASYSDLDNDSQSAMAFQWFVNGRLNQTGDNQSLFLSGNYTTDDSLIVSIRVYDGTDWSSWSNSSNVTVGDASVPTIPVISLEKTSLPNTVGNTNNLTVNGTDTASNILTINFTLNRTDNSVVTRSFTVPSGLRSVRLGYAIFASDETLTVGVYNITNVRVCDSSNNCNSTTDRLSFPSWVGLTFEVTQAPDTGSGAGGGGGGGQPPAGIGERKLNILSPLGSDQITLAMYPGRSLEQKFEVINTGNQSLQVRLSCLDVDTVLCQYLRINITQFNLGAGQQLESFFTFAIPEEAQFASGLINLKASAADKEAVLKVNVEARSRLLGAVSTAISKLFTIGFLSLGTARIPFPTIIPFFVLPEFITLLALGRVKVKFRALFLFVMVFAVFITGVSILAILSSNNVIVFS